MSQIAVVVPTVDYRAEIFDKFMKPGSRYLISITSSF
jgi:hypothetical protein